MRLGLPLIGSNMAQFSIQMTDTVMLGWYGVNALAASVMAGSLFFALFILGSGFGWAVAPLVAAAQARNEYTTARRVTRMSLWLVLAYGILILPIMWNAAPVLRILGQAPDLALQAQAYLRVAGFGIFPALGIVVLKSFLSGLERTRVILWATLAAAMVNIAINWVLIFGRLGAPELGLIGAAWASVGSSSLSFLALAVYAARKVPAHQLFVRIWRPDLEAMRNVARLGAPIGLTYLAETGLFAASAMMMGWLGQVTLAAHGVALNLAGMSFMVHLGLSNAATVRVGQAYGQGDLGRTRAAGLAAIVVSLAVSGLTVMVFLGFDRSLVGAFIDPGDPHRTAILAAGSTLLGVAALFQVFDGAQALALGLLRGMADTRVPMVMAILGYWALGVPASYVLGFGTGWFDGGSKAGHGGAGVWSGLVVGLAAVSVLLMIRFWRRTRRV